MTRQATDQLYIELEYFTPEEYYVYIAEANSIINSSASVSCEAEVIPGGNIVEANGAWISDCNLTIQINKLVSVESTMTVVVSIAATISHIEGADLFAFTDAQLAVQIEVIKRTNIELSGVFSTAIDAVRSVYVSAQADSATEVNVSALRNRTYEAAAFAAFLLTSSEELILGASSTLSSEFNSNIVVNKILEVESALTSNFTITIDLKTIIDATASINSEFTQIIQPTRIIEFASTSNALFTPSLTIDVLKNHTAVLDAVATVSIDANVIRSAVSNQTANTNVIAISNKIVNIDKNLISQSTLASTPAVWSYGPRNFQPYNGAAITAVQKKFGSHSLWFPTTSYLSNSSYATGSNAAGFAISTTDTNNPAIGAFGQFTIRFWIYPTEAPPADRRILGTRTFDATSDGWNVNITSARNIRFQMYYNNGASAISVTTPGTLTLNTWNLVTIRRFYQDTSIRGRFGIAINGTEYNDRGNFNHSVPQEGPLRLGFTGSSFRGYLDSVEILVGGYLDLTQVPTTEPSTPTAYHQFLVNFNGEFVDQSQAAIESASANIIATAVLAAQVGVFYANNPAALSSASTLSASIDKLTDYSASLASEFAVNATALRIKQLASDIASLASVVADVNEIQNYSAALTSEFAASSDANVVRDATISTDAIFTELVAAAKVGDFLVTMESQADLSATVYKTTDVTEVLDSEFTQTVDGIKAVNADADLSSEFQFAIINDRTRNDSAELDSTALLDAQAIKTVESPAAFTSQFSLITEFNGIIGYSADLNSTATLNSNVYRIKALDADLSSQATLTANTDNSLIAGSNADLSVLAALDIPGERIITATIATDAIFTELVAVAKTGQGFITAEVVANLTTTGNRTAAGIIDAASEFNLTAEAVKTTSATSNLTAVSAISATGTTDITGEGSLTATFTLNADADYTSSAAALVVSAATLTASISRIQQAQADLQVNAFELAIVNVERDFEADLVAATELTAQVGGIFDNQITMLANGGMLTLGNIIHITPYLTYKIAKENRTYKIRSENRQFTIKN